MHVAKHGRRKGHRKTPRARESLTPITWVRLSVWVALELVFKIVEALDE